jgi:hypothetical protein
MLPHCSQRLAERHLLADVEGARKEEKEEIGLEGRERGRGKEEAVDGAQCHCDKYYIICTALQR